MEIPQLQYTVKVVDVNAENSEDIADAAGVQFIEKLVDDTVLRRTSSGSPSQKRIVEMLQIQVPAIRQSGEHSSCANRQLSLPGASHPENPEGCRDDTGAVQGDEPAIQKRMPTIKKKIPKTVEIIHCCDTGTGAEYCEN